MRLRKVYITEDETTTTTGTKIYDLDFRDPLRSLTIGFAGQRYDKSDTNDPLLLNDIDKIEIVDGSDVLFSCSGTQTGAVQLYHTGKRPFLALSAMTLAGGNRNQVKILFGRDESDDELGLDLTRFTNPQLKITHSYTEAAANWAAGTQTVSVSALVAEGAPRPNAFLMTKEIYSWTKATSGDETIDLPRDYPIRFIVLQAKLADTPVYAEFPKVKISCNYDEFVPFNETLEDTAWDNLGVYGFQHVQHEAIGDGSDADIMAYNEMAWNWGCNVSSWNSGQNAVEKRPYSRYSTLGRHTCPDSSGADFTSTFLATDQRAITTFMGWELFCTEVIRFGNLQDAGEFFDPRPWKSLRLIVTQAQTDALSSSVVLQQVRTY